VKSSLRSVRTHKTSTVSHTGNCTGYRRRNAEKHIKCNERKKEQKERTPSLFESSLVRGNRERRKKRREKWKRRSTTDRKRIPFNKPPHLSPLFPSLESAGKIFFFFLTTAFFFPGFYFEPS
jgi:hypothetical protein